jgi:lipopolysaccharide export system protein LptA
LCALGAAILVAGGIVVPKAAAQATTAQGIPNAVQGFSQNRNQPVQIEAATLEVRDKDKIATFSGSVLVTQGDTNLRCKTLVVFYDQEAGGSTMKAAKPGPGGQSQIRKLEAKGGVVVTQKDQTATGETGLFDMKANTVTLSGNVLVTQGQNVLRGDRLIVDLTSGVSRVESGKAGQGRVQGLFMPGSAKDAKDAKDGKDAKGSKDSKDTKDSKPAAGATNDATAKDTPKPALVRPPPIY